MTTYVEAGVEALVDLLERKRLSGWPRPCSLEDYERARDRYVDRIGSRPAVVAVYQFGSVATPGISDLDLCVVLEDAIPDKYGAYAATGRIGSDPYVLMHDPLVLSRSLFRRLPLLFPCFDLSHVFGEQLEVESLAPEQARACALSFAVEYGWTKIPRMLVEEFVIQRTLNIRNALIVAHSFLHSSRLAESAGAYSDPRSHELARCIHAMRESWFAAPAQCARKLIRVLAWCIRAGYDLLASVDELLRDWLIPARAAIGPVVEIGGLFASRFVEPYDPGRALGDALARSWRRRQIVFPLSFYRYLVAMTRMRTDPHPIVPCPEAVRVDFRYESLMANHIRALEAYADFATQSLGYWGSPYLTFGTRDGAWIRVARSVRRVFRVLP